MKGHENAYSIRRSVLLAEGLAIYQNEPLVFKHLWRYQIKKLQAYRNPFSGVQGEGENLTNYCTIQDMRNLETLGRLQRFLNVRT